MVAVASTSNVLCAIMLSHRFDERAAARRTKLKTAVQVPIQRQQIEHETKSTGKGG
jgi:hypothetical protein